MDAGVEAAAGVEEGAAAVLGEGAGERRKTAAQGEDA